MNNKNSWLPISDHSGFGLHNLPYGIFLHKEHTPHACTAIGEQVLDLYSLAEAGAFADLNISSAVFNNTYLNDFIALGSLTWKGVRQRLIELLSGTNPLLCDNRVLQQNALYPQSNVTMQMPVYVRDYTDFYSSCEHATNVGIMFRGKENALMPNWKHLPVAYHGRASSIVVSGQSIVRPKGQMRPNAEQAPVFGPTRQLDFELETAFVIGKATKMGQQISTSETADYVFGLLLFNDWSARDIQAWEYQPLGPFLGKNFGSSVSPWIVPMEALEPFRVSGPVQDVPILPYLQCPHSANNNYDIRLEVWIETALGQAARVCSSNQKYLYWSIAQQLAHHTVNGCNINVGDLMASGTISGPEEGSFGSMLELTWRGTKPIKMPDGSERRFIEDGDTVIIKGWAEKEGLRVSLGEVRSTILGANEAR